jgi:hypothetical protein
MSNPIQNNAYRIIGLDTTASQKEILRRCKEIINRLKISDYPNYDLDVDLPEKLRNESTVKDALKTLQSPKDNVKDYFFWFQVSNANDEKALNYISKKELSKAVLLWKSLSNKDSIASPIYKKNLAILYCLMLINEDDPAYLKESLSIWKEIINSEKFWTVFTKGYIIQNEQTVSENNISSFRKVVAKELSDIYTDLGNIHKNTRYIKDFQEIFNVLGEGTEKNLLQPIYDHISDNLEILKKIKLTEEGEDNSEEVKTDTCANCGHIGPDTGFWMYDDGSTICDKCDKKISKEWTVKVDENLKKLGVDEDKRKWYKTIVKIDAIIDEIEKDFAKLRKNGLYDKPESLVVRDRVAEVIRARSVDLHNYAALYEDADRLIRVALRVSGTKSYKSRLEDEEKKIIETMELDRKNLVSIDLSRWFSKKFAEFKPRFAEYDGKKIYYKDITGISYSGTKSNYSITYNFVISSDSDTIMFSFSESGSNIGNWAKLIGLSEQAIIPMIVKRYVDAIFDKGQTIIIGGLSFDKQGYSRQKLFGGLDYVSWDDRIFIPTFYRGNVTVFKDENGRGRQFETMSMSTMNAVVLPKLLQGCVNRAYANGLIKAKQTSSSTPTNATSNFSVSNQTHSVSSPPTQDPRSKTMGYKCKVCNFKSDSEDAMRNHIITKHKDVIAD